MITRDDYLAYSYRKPLESLQTVHDLTTKVFLFLGYGLHDINLRHLILEANKIGRIRSYTSCTRVHWPGKALLATPPDVFLIDMECEHFLQAIEERFPIDVTEWGRKEEAQFNQERLNAAKAIKVCRERVTQLSTDRDQVCLLVDAGTTPLHFARASWRASQEDEKWTKRIQIVTNSPEVLREFAMAQT